MISKFEKLPNELFLNIFSYLSWDEILIALWSLNKRINSLICLTFSVNQSGIVLYKPGLSYQKFFQTLLPMIFNCSLLSSSIKYIYCNGMNSISLDLIYEEIFSHKDKRTIHFPNLKSLYIAQCLLSKSFMQTLSFLIQYQLKQLTLILDKDIHGTFDKEIYETWNDERELSLINSNKSNH